MKARAALRAATAAEHERVDALFSRFDLTGSDGYRRFLLAQAAAFLPLEAALDGAGAAKLVEDWPRRRRSSLLKADLTDLSVPLPELFSTPRFNDSASIMGAIYVLEGSRLGGAVLKRELPPAMPRRFLDAHQEPGSWRKLLEIMDSILYAPEQIDAAAGAAKKVFAIFEAGGLRHSGDQ